MSQKSILNYFAKVPKLISPPPPSDTSPNSSKDLDNSGTFFQTPNRPTTSSFSITPRLPKANSGRNGDTTPTTSKPRKRILEIVSSDDDDTATTHVAESNRNSKRCKVTPKTRLVHAKDRGSKESHTGCKRISVNKESEEGCSPTGDLEQIDEDPNGVQDKSFVASDTTPRTSKINKPPSNSGRDYSDKQKITKKKDYSKTTPASKGPGSSARAVSEKNRILKTPTAKPNRRVGKTTPHKETKRQKWPHLEYIWLKPDKIMDRNKRRVGDPNYDSKTLFVPKEYLDTTTPALRQWWEMKSENFDTILFFKMGKFYELYHMDAVVAVEVLGIVYMKGEIAHCGFPEIAYSTNADIMVARGYKVARCEQTETPALMAARTKSQGKVVKKWDRVVRREICQVTTRGVRIATSLDERSMPFRANAEFLYAVTERNVTSNNSSSFSALEVGVCFVDTTVGTFFLGQFTDDRHCSRLRSLFAHYPPVQILHEKGRLGYGLTCILNNLSRVRKDPLFPDKEFWSADKTLKFLAEGKYFFKDSKLEWPEALSKSIAKGDSLGVTPAEGSELGLRCLGAVTWYLHRCLVDCDLLTLRQFEIYVPFDAKRIPTSNKTEEVIYSGNMVLDGSTLRNLGVTEGVKSMFSVIDNTVTSFGKRLLRFWTCAPLVSTKEISQRQDAICELMGLNDIVNRVTPQMKSLLDLERLLGKLHTFGSIHRSREHGDHPDSRASFFEEKKYSKRKIMDLTSVLKNFKTCVNIVNDFKNGNLELTSEHLVDLIGNFPQLDELLVYFDEAFDHDAAIKAGKILPKPGKVKQYDQAFEEVDLIEVEARSYLGIIRNKFQTSKINFFGKDKKGFQLEIPEKVKVGCDFDFSSSRKGFKRYTTPITRDLLARLEAAQLNLENVTKDITRLVFAQFDESREFWGKAVKCIATLDALISLAKYSKSHQYMCRPTMTDGSCPTLEIKDGYHPCIDPSKYIPNDCCLGSDGTGVTDRGTFLLLTGANMGGKSTTMKQVGLITILAHMGCFVPASSCTMSVVDRIFTRIGAADNISEGESTFFVELSETSAILQHSTKHSLILLDELGRGTATYDGNAIAYAVAQDISKRGARTIFSTHYHSLVSVLQNEPSIQVGHMACMVEREDEKDDDPTLETITFLYKLTSGPCAKSYGFNVAKLAGIPDDVIRLAHRKATEMESERQKVAEFRKLICKISLKSLCKTDILSIPRSIRA